METKPILLLADSQLLFLKNENQESYLKSIVDEIKAEDPKCAYLGASNGDDPVYYDLFTAAMNSVGLSNCKMITSKFDYEEQDFLDKADLILLAGGDTEKGFQIFKENGIAEILQKKYNEGTALIGVSAGAIQLGWQFFTKTANGKNELTDAFKFIPFMVMVHVDKNGINEVEQLLKESTSIKRAYEIPAGGGLIYHTDSTVEALRKPINEFVLKEEEFIHTLIFPGNETANKAVEEI
ncbi:MAG: hypothetical protein JWR18_4181 [Segetibacter sp.]|nr:hypothetical protein [Segetibacter sp.]